jgi:hypothetical protein
LKTFGCLAALVLVCVTGCISPNKDLAAVIKQLAADPATVNLRVTSVYGSVYFTRTAPTTNSLAHTVGPDGTVTVGK